MTSEELNDIWAEQNVSGKPVVVSTEAIWQVAQASERFEQTIFWRDAREWLATALVAGVFLYTAFAHGTIRWLPLLTAILACFPMTYATLRRRKRSASNSGRKVIDHLQDSIASVQLQIGLLRSVLWWYLLPIAICMLLIFVDRLERVPLRFGPWFFIACVFAIAVFAGIWQLNQRAVHNDLEPRLRKLEETLAELGSAPIDPQNS
jgi:hypothetical protein